MEINNNTPQKVLFAAIIIALLLVGFVDYGQQSAINELKQTVSSLSGTGQSQQASGPVKSLAEQIKSNAINSKNITGEVKEIAGDHITIAATLVDLSKIQEGGDYSKGVLPTTQKTFKVSVTPDMKFPQKQKSDIKVGDKAVIYTDKSPYENDALKAMVVSSVL